MGGPSLATHHNKTFGGVMENLLTSGAVVLGLVILVLEYILGKTKWIAPNSTIDTVVQLILKIGKGLLNLVKKKNV